MIHPFQPIKNIILNDILIHPLTLIHSSDLEIISPYLQTNELEIWKLFEENANNGKLIAPFYKIIHQYCELKVIDFRSDRIKKLINDLENPNFLN
jgi:hypothetical protein